MTHHVHEGEWCAACVAHGRSLGPDHSVAIAENLAYQDELQSTAVRTTDGPNGRCYEMADGRLLVLFGAQPPDTDILHSQYPLPITREVAEDFYGYRRVAK